MIEYSQSQLQWEKVHIPAYLTQRKLNTQQIAYPSEKQDKIPKNKPNKKKGTYKIFSITNIINLDCQM